MKKRIIIFVCIVLFFLLLRNPYFKNRIYFGDRITGGFLMTVAGKTYFPTDGILEYENTGTQRLTGVTEDFTIKGGQYGSYKIGFVLENEELYELTKDDIFKSYNSDPTLEFFYVNANWWHVTKMDLTAEMVLSKGKWIVNCKAVYREPLENGGVEEYTVEKSFTYKEIMEGKGIVHFGL